MPVKVAKPKTEKQEQFSKLVKLVGAMDAEQRAAVSAKMGVVVNTTGHVLSAFNTCLLYSQSGKPLTIVGGFRQWLAQGRCVAKGQHGYLIWIPIGKRKAADGSADDDGRCRFTSGTVFDISQTVELGAENGGDA